MVQGRGSWWWGGVGEGGGCGCYHFDFSLKYMFQPLISISICFCFTPNQQKGDIGITFLLLVLVLALALSFLGQGNTIAPRILTVKGHHITQSFKKIFPNLYMILHESWSQTVENQMRWLKLMQTFCHSIYEFLTAQNQIPCEIDIIYLTLLFDWYDLRPNGKDVKNLKTIKLVILYWEMASNFIAAEQTLFYPRILSPISRPLSNFGSFSCQA